MKLKKLEERFYQMTGETWKLSNGHKLGVRKYSHFIFFNSAIVYVSFNIY